MAHGNPDYVSRMTIVVTKGEPSDEFAIATFGSVSTSSSSYQTVKSLTVTADRVGVLRAVEISCSNYAVAQLKLEVAGVTIFEDKKLPESFTKEFPDLRVAAGEELILSVKSDGSTTIVAYCDFSYKEAA